MESPNESCSSIELSDDEMELICAVGGVGGVAGSAQCVEPLVLSETEKTKQFAVLLRARLAEAAPAGSSPLVTMEAAGQQLLMVSAPLGF
jgi:hypothetical protein